jgi:hypothetical protein
MTCPVEVLEIQCVVEDLIDCRGLVNARTNLELNNEYDLPEPQNNICASTNSRNFKLDKNVTVARAPQ